MKGDSRRPRIVIVAGTLAQGGAEKQLVYLTEALRTAGAEVRVLSLTRGEFFEPALRDLGVEPVWVGRYGSPALRTAAVAAALRDFRPHILQAAHFYVNLYVSLVAPLYRAIGIGTARSDVVHEVQANGRWGRWLLRAPSALIVNSQTARRNAMAFGIPAESVHVVPNAIDLRTFDESVAGTGHGREGNAATVISVGSLIPVKRFDRFLRAIALARVKGAPIRGMLVGDGLERSRLEELASELDLLPDGVSFVGRRDDVPALLRSAHVYLLTSEHEGFPNVLLEAMAARLPVVTTPAGDSAVIVEEGVSGFIVGSDDIEAMATHLVTLSLSPALRCRLGTAGRARVEESYAFDSLAQRVARAHRMIAKQLGHRRALSALCT